MLFDKVPSKKKSNTKLKEQLSSDIAYKTKIKICRKKTHNFLRELFRKEGFGKVKWNKRKDDDDALEFIINCAKLLCKLRAPVEIWTEKDQSGDTAYSFSTPIIEEPERLINHLYNISRGRALLHGRNYLELEDVQNILRITLSSMPYDRYLLFNLLYENTSLTTKEAAEKLNCSERHSKRIFEILKVLKLCTITNYSDDKGRPMNQISLNEETYEIVSKIKETIALIRKSHPVSLMSEIKSDIETTQREQLIEKEIGHENDIEDSKMTCSSCGGKLSSKHIVDNLCPLCSGGNLDV
jgi:hypothetical protein